MDYGFWESDWSAEMAARASRDIAELQAGHGGVFWTEFDPRDGRSTLVFHRDGQRSQLTPAEFSLRSRVYEYGGGAFCVTGDGVAFVNEGDQQLYHQRLNGLPQALTHTAGRRYGGLVFDACRQAVLAVEEEQGDQVEHRIVSIALGHGLREVLVEGADFYAGLALSDDGQRLAWIEWDRPQLPWTETRLCLAQWSGAAWVDKWIVAGGQGGESLQQPQFDGQGRLYCLSDQLGWWQPWAEQGDEWTLLSGFPVAQADHAPAPWQLGVSSYLALNDELLLSRHEQGFGVLVAIAAGKEQQLASRYTRFRQLAADDRCFYAIAAAPEVGSTVIAIDRVTRVMDVLAGGECPLPAQEVSQPEALRFASGDGVAHAFFYPPCNSACSPPVGELPPLVVFLHGGPTSACYPVFDPRIQFWTQRGFSVADLNYRGSSGFGRAGRLRLQHAWGDVDVADACELVRVLGAEGRIDTRRAFIRGASAGGFTALLALSVKGVFRGGASLYGVSDPLALRRVTHKFEADYLDWLIGDPQRDSARYAERTPLLHADRIDVPVIFFQGGLDAVVVPAQTESMVDALRRRGVLVEYHLFANERHGFRQAEHVVQVLEAELAFYRRLLVE